MNLIKGKQSRARFGLSLTRAGDLNLDGYQGLFALSLSNIYITRSLFVCVFMMYVDHHSSVNKYVCKWITDIAVGSPYDGPFENGAVYIFNGGPKGLREIPSQVL